MNLELEDKVVILTGGTGGIGAAIASEFLEEKAILILIYRNDKKYQALREKLLAQYPAAKLFGYQASITDEAVIKTTISSILQAHKRIDVLVNCAGMAIEKPFLLMDDGEYELIESINFKSPVMLSKAVLRPMFKQRQGNIVNITSVSGTSAGRGIVLYASFKAALNRFTETLAQEVGKKSIRINAVSPGIVETEMANQVITVAGDQIKERTCLQRYGLPHEISKTVVFLASDKAASYITGQIFHVNGGMNL